MAKYFFYKSLDRRNYGALSAPINWLFKKIKLPKNIYQTIFLYK